MVSHRQGPGYSRSCRSTTNAIPPPVAIEGLAVDGVSVWSAVGASQRAKSGSGMAPLRVPPGRQRFEFHYTALSFTAPERVRFNSKLEGLETDWMDAGKTRSTEYNYLPPGAYRFRVIACNNDDIWNIKGASLAFSVLPFFWQTWWFCLAALGCGAGLIGASVLLLTRTKMRRRLQDLERQRVLERERTRIARDIHDDLGASLTRITLLSQSAYGELDGQSQAGAHVQSIYHTARELPAMDEIVWAVNPQHDTLDSLVTYLGRFAQSFLAPAPFAAASICPCTCQRGLSAELRHNVFLAFKEALNNVAKHARASEVRITLEFQPGGFALIIADNGCGFDFDQLSRAPQTPSDGARAGGGNGLINMQRRLREVGGRCEWDTSPRQGVRGGSSFSRASFPASSKHTTILPPAILVVTVRFKHALRTHGRCRLHSRR